MQNSKNNKSINFFYPIAFVLGIVPLIVRLVTITPNSNIIKIMGTAQKNDLFSQRKATFLMVFSVILIVTGIVAFFIRIRNKDKETTLKEILTNKDKAVGAIVIAAIIFLAFTLFSAIHSTYRQEAFWGMYDRAEGFVTIACYMVIFIYSVYTFKTTENYKYIVIPILIVVSINAFLGLFQYIGQDLIQSELGRLIALPEKSRNIGLTLQYAAGKLYGTLFHYDYVGSFVAIVFPILFLVTVFEEYNIFYKILTGIGTLLTVWLLLGSTSRGGIVGVVASVICGIIIFWKLVVKKKKIILISAGCLVVIGIIAGIVTHGAAYARIPSLATDFISLFKDTSNIDYRQSTPVQDIKNTDTGVEITVPNDVLKISYEDNNYVFKNSKDEIVKFDVDNAGTKTAGTKNANFSNISFKVAKITPGAAKADGLVMYVNNAATFQFKLKSLKTPHLVYTNSGVDIDIAYPETIGFKGKEQIGSARGYIWSRTLPLLKSRFVLGSGPDTFIYSFPETDLIGLYYAYGTPNMVVDKPHNMYLQIAVNEGIIALLAFLAIMIIYIVDSFKLYAFKEDYYEEGHVYGAATCLGVIGYLFSGITNDSVISVAPVFWIVLGVGVALNCINRQKAKKKLKKSY